MSGTGIVTELLLADPTMAAIAARGGLKEDRLPDGVTLTAVLLRTVSSTDRQPLKVGALIRSSERIAVTVRAASVRDRKAAIRTIRAACHGKTGDLAECFRVSVRTAGLGPSVLGPGNSFEQTQDFRVSFDAPA
ncbi:tail completion protein gp17 [Sphingomonas sp. Leaf37]|uniref:tail completion protein gp17 n=1 Tax=Sphingomonas sp. Leaf37 TaxID=2876552 RepID=UPI001E314E0F|nr:hypothetical protein [Sphingomonas sp. Leaf37]